jgi:uncharacterized protein
MGLRLPGASRRRAGLVELERPVVQAGQVAEALAKLLADYGALAEVRQTIRELEQSADQYAHGLSERVELLPGRRHEREDLAQLARFLHEVVELTYGTVNRLFLYEITKPTVEMQRLADVLLAQTRELKEAWSATARRDGHAVAAQHAHAVSRLEAEAERLLNDALATLFRGNDPMQTLKHKEIYETLRRACDRCEAAASILERLARRTL